MKNMKLGRFMNDSYGDFHGKISGLGLGSESVISELVTSSAGKEYLRFIADPIGEAYEIGVGFKKEKDGLTYYSVVLDSPLFPTPIHGALFPDKDEENTFNLVWNRSETPGLSVDNSTEAQKNSRRSVGSSVPVAAL